MLKFRVTKSTRARRAAEAQRKPIEDMLRLGMRWNPVESFMNTHSKEYIYWIPPLFKTSMLPVISSTSYPSLLHALPTDTPKKMKLTQTRRRSIPPTAITGATENHSYDGIIGNIMEENSENKKILPDDQNIYDECENQYETVDLVKYVNNPYQKRSPNLNSSIKRRRPSFQKNKTDFQTQGTIPYETKRTKKVKQYSSLLKLLEKFTKINNSRANKLITYDSLKGKGCRGCFGKKKARRPTVKVYPKKKQSTISRQASKTEDEVDCCIVVCPTKNMSDDLIDTSTSANSNADDNMSNNVESYQNAQFQMMIQILSQMFEDKINQQEEEIKNLRTKVLQQDRLMKKLAQIIMALKSDVDLLKKTTYL